MAADPITQDTIDDLFREDDLSDFGNGPFQENPISNARDDKPTLSPRKRKIDDNKENFGLGLDEEIKITKRRRPVAKLDEARLLSQPGLPKIRQLLRSGNLSKKLRLKGKGHEFKDAAKLLNYYQLWLDNLYPRAKFADALQLVEKAGHSKRMHINRTEWINEGKPGYMRDQSPEGDSNGNRDYEEADGYGTLAESTSKVKDAEQNKVSDQDLPLGPENESMFFPNTEFDHVGDDHDASPDDDELDALLALQDVPIPFAAKRSAFSVDDDSEGEDDLDALLAAQDAKPGLGENSSSKIDIPVYDDDDDLDALLAEQEIVQSHDLGKPQVPSVDHIRPEDEDELDILLAQQSGMPEPELPSQPFHTKAVIPIVESGKAVDSQGAESDVPELDGIISSSPIPNVRTDDLDELLDEHEAAQKELRQVEFDTELLSSSPIPNDIAL